MTRQMLYRAAAYAVASTLTAITALALSLPFTGINALFATADAALLVGLPALHAADAITRRRGGNQ